MVMKGSHAVAKNHAIWLAINDPIAQRLYHPDYLSTVVGYGVVGYGIYAGPRTTRGSSVTAKSQSRCFDTAWQRLLWYFCSGPHIGAREHTLLTPEHGPPGFFRPLSVQHDEIHPPRWAAMKYEAKQLQDVWKGYSVFNINTALRYGSFWNLLEIQLLYINLSATPGSWNSIHWDCGKFARTR